MRVLADTHAVFWWLVSDERLSRPARRILDDEANEVLVSSVVSWEIATKSRIGKWPAGRVFLDAIEAEVIARELTLLSITLAHARLAGLMPGEHKDPFDRLLVAQAKIEEVPLITSDRALSQFGVDLIW